MPKPEELAELLSTVLRRRLADVEAADERRRRFVAEPGEPAPSSAEGSAEDPEAVRDLVLRALTRAADPVNHAILRRLVDADRSIEELSGTVGIPVIATSERVNDLLQVGLVGRTLRGDEVGATEAGRALVAFVDAVAAGAGTKAAAG